MKVSIVTVCYNSAATIEKTIQSVINQSYPNIEYIIIDGGSMDGTVDIIRKYEDKIAYWVSEHDGGIYDAMNKGIRVATGDVVGIINSDDWYELNAIQLIAECFLNNEDAVYGDLMIVDTCGQKMELYSERNLKKRKLGGGYPHPTVFLKRMLYERYGLFDTRYKIAADYDLTSRLELHGIRFKYVPRVIANFRRGGVSTVGHSWNCMIETRIIARGLAKKVRLLNLTYEAIDFMGVIKKQRQMYMIEYIKKRILRNPSAEFSAKILMNNDKNGYIVWGCGEVGAECVNWLNSTFTAVEYIIDSDVHKQGKKFMGVNVICPYQSSFAGKFILIATTEYFKEIANILMQNGLCENRDFMSFSNYQLAEIKTYCQQFFKYWR